MMPITMDDLLKQNNLTKDQITIVESAPAKKNTPVTMEELLAQNNLTRDDLTFVEQPAGDVEHKIDPKFLDFDTLSKETLNFNMKLSTHMLEHGMPDKINSVLESINNQDAPYNKDIELIPDFPQSDGSLALIKIGNILKKSDSNTKNNKPIANQGVVSEVDPGPDLTNEMLAVPTSFANEFLLNAPRSIAKQFDVELPQAETTPGKIASGIAGVAGAIAGPGKFLKAGKLGTPLFKSIKQGAAYGLARFPTDNPVGIVERAKTGAIGGAAAGVFFGFGKFLKGLFSTKDKVHTIINKQLETGKKLEQVQHKLATLTENSSEQVQLAKQAATLAKKYNNQGKLLEQTFKKTPLAQQLARSVRGATPEELLSDRLSPDQAQQLVQKLSRLDDDSILNAIDLGDESVRGLTRSVARIPGASKDKITRFLENRSVRSSGRIKNALNEYLSEKEYFSTLDDVIAERTELSKPFY